MKSTILIFRTVAILATVVGSLRAQGTRLAGPVTVTNFSTSLTRCVKSVNGVLTVDTGSCLANPMTDEGDVIYGGAAGAPTRLPRPSIGFPAYLYMANSSSTPVWQQFLASGPLSFSGGVFACASCMTNPMTTSGDMIVGGGGGAPARLATSGLGGTNFLIQQGAASPGWVNAIFSAPLGYSSGVFSCATCVTSVGASGLLSSTGGTTPTISCATCMANPMTTSGDIIYGGSGGSPTRLANPGIGYPAYLYLANSGSVPAWQQFLASGPLSFSGGIFQCSTCVTNVTASSPLSSSGGTTPNLTLQQASSLQNGYLSSTDHATFSAKMSNPMNSSGDLIYGAGGGAPTRLGAPFSGENFLTSTGGTPFWRNIIASSPLSYSTGVFSCASCVTNTGTWTMSGNFSFTGNLYVRTVAGTGISCSGIADGWFAANTSGTPALMACIGGSRYKIDLASY